MRNVLLWTVVIFGVWASMNAASGRPSWTVGNVVAAVVFAAVLVLAFFGARRLVDRRSRQRA